MVGFGNYANFMLSNVFIAAKLPRYVIRFINGLVFTCVGFLLIGLVFILLYFGNRRRRAICAQMTSAERAAYNKIYFDYVY